MYVLYHEGPSARAAAGPSTRHFSQQRTDDRSPRHNVFLSYRRAAFHRRSATTQSVCTHSSATHTTRRRTHTFVFFCPSSNSAAAAASREAFFFFSDVPEVRRKGSEMGSAYKSDPLPPLAGFATAGGSSSNSVGDADGMSFNLEAMRRAAYGHVNPRRPDTVELRDEVPAGARRPRAAPHGGAGGVWRGATGGEGGQERCASMNHSRASLSNQMAFTTRVHHARSPLGFESSHRPRVQVVLSPRCVEAYYTGRLHDMCMNRCHARDGARAHVCVHASCSLGDRTGRGDAGPR